MALLPLRNDLPSYMYVYPVILTWFCSRRDGGDDDEHEDRAEERHRERERERTIDDQLRRFSQTDALYTPMGAPLKYILEIHQGTCFNTLP